MISLTPENRKTVLNYLNSISEDSFIEDVIIPFYSSNGYYLYRINEHGPGEHGKDLIFYRHVPSFFDNEYIVVQAKAEKLTTSNVAKFAGQIKRALDVPFKLKSGSHDQRPHYAIFLNARAHTNDADHEFNSMIHGNPHIKILSQENISELILRSGIGPKTLIDALSKDEVKLSASPADKLVFDTIMVNNPAAIDQLLDHQVKLIRRELTERSKRLIIDYIFERWKSNRSWEGTVKPMKWLNDYFDFFCDDQYVELMEVFREYTSSTPSFAASSDTYAVVRKVNNDVLSKINSEFIKFCAELSTYSSHQNKSVIFEKLRNLYNSGLIIHPKLKELSELILEANELRTVDREAYMSKIEDIFSRIEKNDF